MSDKTTVAEVVRAANSADEKEGAWVDGSLELCIRSAKPKNGKAPSKATGYDPNTGEEIGVASFGVNLVTLEGRRVRIDGKGNKAKKYNGAVEVTVGKNGTIDDIGAADSHRPAPAANERAPRDDSRGGGGNPPPKDPPPDTKPKVDPTTYFHRELSKLSLGYLHCLQYAQDIAVRNPLKMTDDQFQACVSSLFIQGNKDGLFAKVPKLREVDADKKPLKYIPPEPDPAVV